jgi:histidinol-phosphate phosphatase family protein
VTPARPDLVLLDRDGVILEHVEPYVLRHEDVRPLAGALDAVATLLRTGIKVAVVTNQSPIGRGMVSRGFVDEVHATLAAGLPADHDLTFYVCPHVPADGCACRKPAPGLLLAAARDHGVTPARSWMVGDHDTDLEAGRAAGCAELVHVPSGRQVARSPHATMTVDSLPALVTVVEQIAR